jgi:hypothetical protein
MAAVEVYPVIASFKPVTISEIERVARDKIHARPAL